MAFVRSGPAGHWPRPARARGGLGRWCRAALAAALSGPIAGAAEVIPLRDIEGGLYIRADLRTAEAGTAAFVALDLGTRAPLLVHERTAALLGIGGRGPVELDITGTAVSWSGLDAVAAPAEPLEAVTREHSRELDELPAVAVLGMPAFNDRRIALDVGERRLRLSPAGAARSDPPPDATTLIYTAEAYGYWLEAEAPDGSRLRVRLATSEYDTRIDAGVAERLGAPGGNLDRLMLGGVDVMRYAILRPSDHSRFPEPRPDVILGTGFFSHFVAVIDPARRTLELRPMREPHLPTAERELFVARAQSDARGVEAFLEANPDSRLAAEASEALLAFRLAAPKPDRERMREAMRWRARTAPSRRRAKLMADIADELIALDEERDDAHALALMAIEIGEPYAADDLDDTAIHHLNARRGLIALLDGDYGQARRYLLSAAFGLPKDPYVNLWLGRLYEVTGQLPRAWSRYVEASLRDKPPIGSLRGLDRLNHDAAFREQFSMDDAAELLEGRVPEFMPARRFEPDADAGRQPAALVELFTDIDEASTQAAQMAMEALAAYLPMAGTVFVQYHVVDVLATDASEARAAYYGGPEVPAAYFDGRGPVTEGGEDDAAARVFDLYTEQCMAPRRGEIALQGRAWWQGEQLHVRVDCGPAGPIQNAIVHALLCERAVMAIGQNGRVLHKHVVRASLSPASGWRRARASRRQRFTAEASLSQVREQLERRMDRLRSGDKRGPAMQPTWVDPAACEVVVFVQDVRTRRVAAAIRLTPEIRKNQN